MAEQFNLGRFMKSYREQRHISLRAASPDAASTLSRFENGKTRISGDRLRSVMQREGVRYWDLQQHAIEYLSPFKQLIDCLYITRFDQHSDVAAEAVRLYKVRTRGASSELVDVVAAILSTRQEALRTGQEQLLMTAEQERIQNILFRARDWIIFDYGLLWLAAPYLDSPTLKRNFKRAVIQRSEAMPAYNDYFVRVLQRVFLILLSRRDEEAIELCGPQLKKAALNGYDGEDTLTIQFLDLVIQPSSVTDKRRRVNQFLAKLKLLELDHMREYFADLAAKVIMDVPRTEA
jgi:transcriptional regulator with XRE-family HTH domain